MAGSNVDSCSTAQVTYSKRKLRSRSQRLKDICLDAIRSQTMPVNKKWNVESLLKACRFYAQATHRRISFEYAMIRGVNDSDACARELGQKLHGMLCHVNLIPVNDVTGAGYHKSSIERQQSFIHILQQYGITATVRRTLGSDIDASCGQLRRRYEKEAANENAM